MPRFVYTLLFITALLAIAIVHTFFFTPPNSVVIIALFVLGLQTMLSILLSTALFLIMHKGNKKINIPNKLFRKYFRRIFLISLALAGLTLLNIFNTLTAVTGILLATTFTVIYILTELRAKMPSL